MPSIFKVPFNLKQPTFPLRHVQDWFELNSFFNYRTLSMSFPLNNAYDSNHLGVVQAIFRNQGQKIEESKLNTNAEIKWFTEKLPLSKEAAVLDLNCGTGLISRNIAPQCKKVVGTDISRHLLNFAKGRPIPENVEFHRAEASDLPFPDSSFDVVFSRHSFTHFIHRAEVLDEMRRVCKPGGFIGLMERILPDELDEETAIRMEFLEGVRDPSHVYFMTAPEMLEMFKENNIEVTLKEVHTCAEPYEDYLSLTNVNQQDRAAVSQYIYGNMISPDPEYQQTTGFYPHLVEDVVNITHHFAMIGGKNPTEKPIRQEEDEQEQHESELNKE